VADDTPISPNQFGMLFRGFLEQALTAAPAEQPFVARRLREHFGTDPHKLPTLKDEIDRPDHPNLHLAIEAYLQADGRRAELVGFSGIEHYGELSISTLLLARGGGAKEGPVQYASVALADGQVLPCVARGLYLIADGAKKLALLVSAGHAMMPGARLQVDVMAPDHADAVRLLGELRTSMRRRNVYRGHVISLGVSPQGDGLRVDFHRLRPIERGDIVLPPGVLERIERQTAGFSRQRDRLLAARRHLKRGLLLYGPPGTGKTLTAMYLATQMKDRTTFLLTGHIFGFLERSCAMARLLEPATMILEDIDLIAGERTGPGACGVLLFELLNQMDGLADDADIVFILTTNRPDILEPALAARPGRVDLAVEIPQPDADCRRRLLDLYGRGLTMRVSDVDRLVQRTEGVSAAFIRELLRRAALVAADETGDTAVEDRHIDSALHELLVLGGGLTRSLLGVAGAPA
jgi:hypothetical protein